MVILVVIAIVVNIGLEALPLFGGASAGEVRSIGPRAAALAAGTDPRRELVWTLEDDGLVRLDRGDEPFSIVEDGAAIVAADHEIHGLVSALTDGGSVVIGTVKFRDLWTGDERTTSARWRSSADPLDLPTETDWVGVTANADSDGARGRGGVVRHRSTRRRRAGTPTTRNGRAIRSSPSPAACRRPPSPRISPRWPSSMTAVDSISSICRVSIRPRSRRDPTTPRPRASSSVEAPSSWAVGTERWR